MRLLKRRPEPSPAPTAPGLRAIARARLAEAARLDWDRASQRVIRSAQEAVALERENAPPAS